MGMLVLVPIANLLITTVTLALCYYMSTHRESKRQPFFFPYVSATGALMPERAIFGPGMIFTGILSALQSCVRAALWRDIFEDARNLRIDPRSSFDSVFVHKRELIIKAHLALGLFSASCMSIVSTIAEGEIGSLHTIAASIGFGGVAIYCAIDTFFSLLYVRLRKRTRNVRCVLCVLLAFFLLTISMLHFSRIYYRHQIKALCEYLAIFTICAYMLTFTNENLHAHFTIRIQRRIYSYRKLENGKINEMA